MSALRAIVELGTEVAQCELLTFPPGGVLRGGCSGLTCRYSPADSAGHRTAKEKP